MKKIFTAVLWVAAIACGDDSSSSNDSIGGDRAATIAALTPDVTNGQAQFESICSLCHGIDGTNDSLGFDLTKSTKSKSEIIDVLLNGIAGTTMTNYANMSDQNLADLAAYALQFRQ